MTVNFLFPASLTFKSIYVIISIGVTRLLVLLLLFLFYLFCISYVIAVQSAGMSEFGLLKCDSVIFLFICIIVLLLFWLDEFSVLLCKGKVLMATNKTTNKLEYKFVAHCSVSRIPSCGMYVYVYCVLCVCVCQNINRSEFATGWYWQWLCLHVFSSYFSPHFLEFNEVKYSKVTSYITHIHNCCYMKNCCTIHLQNLML